MQEMRRESIYQLFLITTNGWFFVYNSRRQRRIEKGSKKKFFLLPFFFLYLFFFFLYIFLLLFAFQFSIFFSFPIPSTFIIITDRQADWLNIYRKDKYTPYTHFFDCFLFFLCLSSFIHHDQWSLEMVYYTECMFCFSNVTLRLSVL
jgi:hypothetical protein